MVRNCTMKVKRVYLGQLTHVEEVVEFGRCWQHLCRDLVPQRHSEGHQLLCHVCHLLTEVVRIKATLKQHHSIIGMCKQDKAR